MLLGHLDCYNIHRRRCQLLLRLSVSDDAHSPNKVSCWPLTNLFCFASLHCNLQLTHICNWPHPLLTKPPKSLIMHNAPPENPAIGDCRKMLDCWYCRIIRLSGEWHGWCWTVILADELMRNFCVRSYILVWKMLWSKETGVQHYVYWMVYQPRSVAGLNCCRVVTIRTKLLLSLNVLIKYSL